MEGQKAGLEEQVKLLECLLKEQIAAFDEKSNENNQLMEER